MRVAVVGGGIVGLCLARDLRHRGADVVIIDAHRCGSGCSSGNAGWVCPALSAPLASPSALRDAVLAAFRPRSSPLSIRPNLGTSFTGWGIAFMRSATKARYESGRAAMLALNRRTQELFDELRDDGVAFELHSTGMIAGARSEAALERLAAGFDALAAAGYAGEVDVLARRELRHREPAFGDAVVGGIHLKSERHVRPETLNAGLLRRLRELGVAILEGAEVTDLRRGRGSWTLVAAGRDVKADRVVVAAGAASARVLDTVGVRLLLQPARGYSITSAGTGTRPRHVLYMPELKVGCSPFEDAVRLVGTFELGAREASAPPDRVQRVTRAWARCLRDWRPLGAPTTWAGLRPMAPDSLPIMGEVPGAEGLFVSTGHGLLGLTTAPASAAALGALVVEDRHDPVLEPFRIERVARWSGGRPIGPR